MPYTPLGFLRIDDDDDDEVSFVNTLELFIYILSVVCVRMTDSSCFLWSTLSALLLWWLKVKLECGEEMVMQS